MTTRALVHAVLDSAWGLSYTATDLAKLIERPLPSVSSLLKRMVDAGELRRRKGKGPRGGYGYYVAGTEAASVPR